MAKKICAKHIQKALALEAKYRGLMERPDKPDKTFTTKENF